MRRTAAWAIPHPPRVTSRLDDDLRRRAFGALDGRKHLSGDVAIDFGVRSVGLGRDHRQAGVRRLTDRHVQRYLAKERHAEPLSLVPRAAVTEDVRARAAFRTEEVAHVLDDAEDRDADPLEHPQAAQRIAHGDLLHGRYVWGAWSSLTRWIDILDTDRQAEFGAIIWAMLWPLRALLTGYRRLLELAAGPSHRRQEHYADLASAVAAGTRGAVRSLELFLFSEGVDVTIHRAAINREDVGAALAAFGSGLTGERRAATRGRVDIRKSRIDDSHPPTATYAPLGPNDAPLGLGASATDVWFTTGAGTLNRLAGVIGAAVRPGGGAPGGGGSGTTTTTTGGTTRGTTTGTGTSGGTTGTTGGTTGGGTTGGTTGGGG